jgi:YesN/AraC family two-component response regulator
MKDKKLFLNEEITLKDIAETLHISQHQLSQLINEKFNVNFNTFINSYRIEFAKKPSYRKTSPNCVYNSL